MKILSIITVTHNSSKTIKAMLDSIKKQYFYKSFELIIVDNLSKDKTLKIIDQYKNCFKIKKIVEKDNGIYDAMNKGAKIANGRYLLFLNSDDILVDRGYFQKFSFVKTKFNSDIIYSKILFKKNRLGLSRIYNPEKLFISNYKKKWLIPHPGTIVKKNLFFKLKGFNPKYKISGDFDFFLRASKLNGLKYHFINSFSVLMNIGGASSGFKNIVKSNLECINSLSDNNIKLKYLFILKKIISKFFQLKLSNL